MGISTAFKLARSAAAGASNVVDFPRRSGRAGVVSPWAEGQLQQVVWSNIFGQNSETIPTRADAMSLPAVVKGRAVIIERLAARPLRALRGGEPLAEQPAWLYRTNTPIAPYFRMAHTLDDMIFYGQSLWAFDRGSEGQILDAVRVPYDRWDMNEDYLITIDDEPVDAREVCYFQGPFEGLLTSAQRTINGAVSIESSWRNRARTPTPSIILAETEDNELSDVEIDSLVAGVAAARREPDGSVMWVPHGVDARFEEGDNGSSQLLIEARNAVKLDIANFLNLPTSALDAALPKASLNYETQSGTEQITADRMHYWSDPLEARLSLDDVCARGQRIAFDFGTSPTEPGNQTGPYKED